MQTINILSVAILVFGLISFVRKRLLRYLRFLQQDDYSSSRFLNWVYSQRAFDRKGTFTSLLLVIPILIPQLELIITTIVGLILFYFSKSESDPRLIGKKKLVLTQRAKKIFYYSLLLAIFVETIFLIFHVPIFINAIIICQAPFLFLVAIVSLLAPKEKALQEKLRKEAHDKFCTNVKYAIGVTGSFGKTSVKNMLGEILSMSIGPTFYPQAGVNTPMGITREIREKLTSAHKHAVIEMGAYHIGSIKRLCNLTPVNAAIVTAVHLMHLDRFGGTEEVYKAKSELPQAVPDAGILVVNGDNPGARKMATEFRKKHTYIYGLDTSLGVCDVTMTDIQIERGGTRFCIVWSGRPYQGFLKMHGNGALSNLLASFTMACALGADPDLVLSVARNLEPVSNRLEVKDYGDYIQINDAYNSNPVGFMCALQVLRDLPGNRRILITPGMIELGERQYDENKKIASEAAKICDLALIVNKENKEALISGLQEGGMQQDKIHYFETRDAALKYLASIRLKGDIVLLENDLPDLNEFVEFF